MIHGQQAYMMMIAESLNRQSKLLMFMLILGLLTLMMSAKTCSKKTFLSFPSFIQIHSDVPVMSGNKQVLTDLFVIFS